ncbi:MAG: TrmH family RNA methyltransferase [Sciscionella sp.]
MAAIIDSIRDPRLSTVRELSSAAARAAALRCVIEGDSLVEQAIRARLRLDFVLAVAGHPLLATAAGLAVPTYPVGPAVLRQALRTQRPVTALAVAHVPRENDPNEPYGDTAVVLDRVRDPGNVGTIVRTALALGAHDLVCTDAETDLTSRKVLESSRCGALRAGVRRFADPVTAARELRSRGFQVVATSPQGPLLQSLAPLSAAPVAIVLGNETSGAAADTLRAADLVVRIPMAAEVDSLNVGVAAGLSIVELRAAMLCADLERRCATLGDLDPGELGARLSGLRSPSPVEVAALLAALREGAITEAGRRTLVAVLPLLQPV